MSAVISNANDPLDSSELAEDTPTTLEDNVSNADTDPINDQLILSAQLNEVRETLARLSGELRGVDAELDGISDDRKQHRLLLDVCNAFDQLQTSGGANLFWTGPFTADAGAEHLLRVRNRADQFHAVVAEIEGRRQGIVDRIKEQQHHADLFEDGLFEALDEEERLNQEWIIEREIEALPARNSVLPWTRGGEDDQRFRKSWRAALLACLIIAVIFPWITLPLRDRDATAEIPDRVVQLLVQSRPKPPPPPTPKEIKPKEQKPEEEKVVKETRQSKPDKQTVAPEEPQKPQGILAFREKFAELKDDEVVARLGSQAAINDAGNSTGRPERAMLTTNAPGSSGGINLALLSKNVGGGAGGGLGKVQTTRATSSIGGIGRPGQDRPLSGDSVGMSRTDEEIQIVFDRYKAAFYRMYNRELRKDPTLRGQMVLKLTIEADGSVSMCVLQASDMNAAELSAQVVERVKTINFGAKEGIPAITILYPIDFLPAA